jgi:LacI family transcriptional regulator
MSVKLVDIARKTGYSVSTISRALSENSTAYKISQSTIDEIRIVATELGYRANKLARGLKSKRTYEIGVAVSDILNPFFTTLIKTISKEVRKIGYTLMLCDSDENTDLEQESIGHLLEKQVEGLIIAPVGINSKYINEIHGSKIPMIVVDRIFENSTFDSVSVDNYKGSSLATEHLIKEGHTRIAFIQGLRGTVTNEQRLMGYKDTLIKYNYPISAEYIVGDDFRTMNGYFQAKKLLDLEHPPTAIFAAGDLITLGCIQSINEKNLNIPQDISLVSFDDPQYFKHLSPSISAVRQPVNDMGIIAVKLLLDRMNRGVGEQNQIQLDPTLMIRNSVKRLKESFVSNY